jgi:hypothetical protein
MKHFMLLILLTLVACDDGDVVEEPPCYVPPGTYACEWAEIAFGDCDAFTINAMRDSRCSMTFEEDEECGYSSFTETSFDEDCTIVYNVSVTADALGPDLGGIDMQVQCDSWSCSHFFTMIFR